MHRYGNSIFRALVALLLLASVATAESTADQDLLEHNHELMALRRQLDTQIDTSLKYDRDIAKKLVQGHGELLVEVDSFDGAVGDLSRTRLRLYDVCLEVHEAGEELQEVYSELMAKKDKPEQLVKKGDLPGYGITLGQLRAKIDEACKISAKLEPVPEPPPVAKDPARSVPPSGALEHDTPQIEILSTQLVSQNGTRRSFEVTGKVRGGIREQNARIALLVYRKGQSEADKRDTARGERFRFDFTVDAATDRRATVLVKDMKNGKRYEVDVWRKPGR